MNNFLLVPLPVLTPVYTQMRNGSRHHPPTGAASQLPLLPARKSQSGILQSLSVNALVVTDTEPELLPVGGLLAQ